MSNPVQEFRDVLEQAGLVVGEIIRDGTIHRCGTLGKERGSDGAYLLHVDSPPSGWWRNYRTGDEGKWTYSNHRGLTQEQRNFQRQRIQQESARRQKQTEQRYAKACVKAERILAGSKLAPTNHPYLVAKGVGAYGAIHVSAHGELIVPLTDYEGHL